MYQDLPGTGKVINECRSLTVLSEYHAASVFKDNQAMPYGDAWVVQTNMTVFPPANTHIARLDDSINESFCRAGKRNNFGVHLTAV